MASRVKARLMVALAISAAAMAIACWRWRRRRRPESGAGQVEEFPDPASLCYSEFVKKPQNNFKRVLADNSYSPFNHFKREGRDNEISLRLHPYEDEITLLLEQPPDLPKFADNDFTDLGPSYVWISTERQLESLAEILNKEQAFAVDTEQHSVRSCLGFTALMQISTKEHDFLLDTVALHDVMGILQPIFSNPSICKRRFLRLLSSQTQGRLRGCASFPSSSGSRQGRQNRSRLLAPSLRGSSGTPSPEPPAAAVRGDRRAVRGDPAGLLFEQRQPAGLLFEQRQPTGLLFVSGCSSETNKVIPKDDTTPIVIIVPGLTSDSASPVFHGSDNDVLWLQRDFHIYVVNMFDTAKVCQVLSKPQKSLAYLLETYCDVSTDKTLQREDWRMRPLSPEMVQYARVDTHYLLYIADCLVSELKVRNHACEDGKSNLVYEACRRSNMVCLQLYSKDVEPSSLFSTAASILSRYSSNQQCTSLKNTEAMELVRQICIWRDLMARIHDESLRFILSDRAIFYLGTNVAKRPEEIHDAIVLADSNAGMSDVSSVLQSPSYVVKSHIKVLCGLLQEVSCNPEDIFRRILCAHLEPNGDCPLSLYNYALLSELDLKVSSTFSLKQNGGSSHRSFGRKASRKLFVQKFSCKSPVYHNCRIFASDGRLLCYCDRRKLEWYLSRCLAKLVVDEPPAIMLLFEPKGRPEDEDNEFYIQSKKNMCVGCGERNHYLRYRIIPSCYRMHFPEHLKSHRSHDIVLLCVDCHEIAHSAAEKHKRQVASEFGVPLFVRKVVNAGESGSLSVTLGIVEENVGIGVSPLQLRTAAMALLRHGSKMPSPRREELVKTVKAYFGGREVSEEDLESVLLVGMSSQERRRLEKKKGLPFKSRDIMKATDKVQISFVATDDNPGNSSPPVGDGSQFAATKTHESFSSRTSKNISLLGHGPHGKQVVEHLIKEHGDDGILHFCQRWRQIFVEAINPRFLPSGWDIMHRGRREFGQYSVYNPTHKDLDAAKD